MKRLPEDMARRLRESSRELLRSGGDLSINRAAEVTGIPRATLYYYFSGKEHLFAFFVDYAIEGLVEGMAAGAQGPGSAAERLQRAVAGGMWIGQEEPWLGRAMMERLGAPAVVNLMSTLYERGYDPIRALLVEGRESGEFEFEDLDIALSAVLGATVTYAMMQFGTKGEVSPDGLASVTQIVINGISTRRETGKHAKGTGATVNAKKRPLVTKR